MNAKDTVARKRWTAAELRKLPLAEREAILEAAAVLAEEEYRKNAELTAFEAFGKDDLYGESSSTGMNFQFEEGDTEPPCGGVS